MLLRAGLTRPRQSLLLGASTYLPRLDTFEYPKREGLDVSLVAAEGKDLRVSHEKVSLSYRLAVTTGLSISPSSFLPAPVPSSSSSSSSESSNRIFPSPRIHFIFFHLFSGEKSSKAKPINPIPILDNQQISLASTILPSAESCIPRDRAPVRIMVLTRTAATMT